MKNVLRTAVFIFVDAFFMGISWMLSLLLLGYNIFEAVQNIWYYYLISVLVTCISAWVFRLYNSMWRYAGFLDALKIMYVVFITLSVNLVIAGISPTLDYVYAIVVAFFTFISLASTRFAFKITAYFGPLHVKANKKTKVIILGAGYAGSVIIREFKTTDKINMHPVCVLDDDESKIGKTINGVKVEGKINDVATFVKKYGAEEILLAIPSIGSKRKKEILEICQQTECKVRIIPGIYQFANGKFSVQAIRDVEITDLLGREQIKVNLDEIMSYIEGKVIMVTGGGGSIGSELCRQIASHNPKKLIILDNYENNAYEIEQELKRNYANLNLDVIIATVREKSRLERIFKEERPNIVFHAAAHKHVPLMERNPEEAVKNNVGGTFNVADCAGKFGVDKFIMISTDKAVNPTNVMGASKRICEMIIQAMNSVYDTDYVAVRFGNVLGSNGSVIPLFKKQILAGGPVTVTHKDIVRYFMTIPEAVSLVLQAGAYAKGGEIFVLDMGEPVRIYDLAVNLIKLSGFEPNVDIDIKITGLRPGEKLFEERLMQEEGLQKTANEMISIGKPLNFDQKQLFETVKELCSFANKGEKKMKEKVASLVDTYKIDYR